MSVLDRPTTHLDRVTKRLSARTMLVGALSTPVGESRIPVMIALLTSMSLPLLMPERLVPGPAFPWVAIEACFLVAMAVTDPGRINRRSILAHRVRMGLVVVLVGGAACATISLTSVIIQGHNSITADPSSLLAGVSENSALADA